MILDLDLSISQLEVLNLVQAVSSLLPPDPFNWLILARNNCDLEIHHKLGSKLVLTDALSHSLHDPLMHKKAVQLCKTT